MAHLHDVLDNDKHFVIDAETRAIVYAGENLPTLIQNDHNSERFTFEIPKSIDGHDTELCNKIRVHYINVSAENPLEVNPGVYEVDDIKVSPDDPTKMIFSWLLDRDATTYVGTLTFLIECMCVSDGDVVDYSWHTGKYTGAVISEGMDNSDIVIGKYYDVIDKWVAQIESEGNRVVADALTRIDAAAKEAKNSSVGAINTHAETVKKDLTIHGLTIDDTLVQETGSSEHKVMSQKATTEMGDALEAARVKSYTELTGRLNAAEETIDNILIDNTHRAYVRVEKNEAGKYSVTPREVYVMKGDVRSYDLYIYCQVTIDYDYPDEQAGYVCKTIGAKFYIYPDGHPSYCRRWSTIEILDVYLYEVIETGGSRWMLKMDYTIDGIKYSSIDDYSYYIDGDSFEHAHPYIDEVYDVEFDYSGPDEIYQVHEDPSLVNAFRIEANGIRDISKTNTESVNGVNVHTYTILLDDGATKTFQVRDGVGISDFAAIEYGDYEDTYRIEFTNGTSYIFKVPNNNSVGIRQSDSGAMIHGEDLTHLEHTVKAKVRSKNMIPYPYNDGVSKETNGITFTVNEDGSISAYGTATETAYMILGKMNRAGQTPIAKGKYILSGAPGNGCAISFGRTDNQGESRRADSTGNEKPLNVEVVNDTTRFDIVCTVYSGTVIPEDSPITFYPQLEEGDVVTPYTPYVDPSSVTLRRCGKNLLPPVAFEQVTESGVTFTKNTDGSITVNGTATALIARVLVPEFVFAAGVQYTLSGCPSGGGTGTWRLDNTDKMADDGAGATITYSEDTVTPIRLRIASGATLDNLVFKPQLEVGDTATEFEKYVGAEYGIASDGKPVSRITSLTPTMNLLANKKGTIIDATYNIDQTAAYNKINTLLETLLNGGA